ncbi:MAG: FtsQ-type POTRA domain-containing protein [Proteobacteria bacterium]|nr:FtsQ-type POTRA domain-containing protein [Pseudomonadota bacterium]
MLFTRIKKTLVSIFRKKKKGYATFANDLHIRGAVAETRPYKNRLHRLANIRQRILSKKTEFQEEYSRPVDRVKMYARFGALILMLTALPLAWLFGGGEKVLQGLQSIAFFRVGKIEITGCTAVPKEKILNASGIILHQTNLLTLDSKQIEARIAAVPWVARTEVKRNWPAKVQISIIENAPVALLHSPGVEGGELQYLDNNGIAFSSVNLGADIDFPIVTGLTEITDLPLKEKVLAEILTFLRKVRDNDPHLPAHSVSELHVTKSGEMVVYLVEYPFPIFFGNGSTKQKYSRLIQVLRALYKKQNAKEMLSQIEYIQMDYLNDKVLVVESGSG